MGGRQVPIRGVVLAAAIAVWLGLMLLETGSGGIASLWASALFLVPLVAIGSLTRSVSLSLIGRLVLVGGFGMSVAWVLIALFTLVVRNTNAPIRDFVIPPIEEAVKFAPVLLILWFERRGRAWSFGATDLLLMGAAIGTGFGLVESAYLREHAIRGQVLLLPITQITGGHLVVSHAIWAAIGGGVLGIALLMRGRGRIAIVIAAAGVAWTTFDHIANNYSAVHPGSLADLLRLITGNGWGSLVIFLVVVIVAIAMDLRVGRTALPPMPELASLPFGGDARSMAAAWGYRIRRRGLAYTVFRGGQSPARERPERVRVAADLAYRLLYRRAALAPLQPSQPVTPGNTL